MNLSELIYYKNNYNKLNNIRKQRNDIIPFVGAGISMQCGLYSWIEMLDMIAKDYFTANEIQELHAKGDCYEYADKIVEAVGNEHMVMSRIGELFNNTKISLTESPFILTSSFSNLIVTTNYDTILEEAACQSVQTIPLKPLLPCLKGQVDAAIQNNARCLLKLHGSIEETSSFVLTSSQYNKFYGTRFSRKNKPLPKYLNKLFTAKKLLFVGCSLEFDRTLDILCECVENDERISHYAIVPWIEDENRRVQRNRHLMKLGVEPIYFPEGDYNSVRKLLRYLAEENSFNKEIENIIKEILDETTTNIICSIVKDTFYDTANEFPKLLDDVFSPSLIEYKNILNEKIHSLSESDTIYSVLCSAFDSYIDLGTFNEKEKIKKYFLNEFANKCLKDKSINEFLKKQWSIRHKLTQSDIENSWIKHLSPEEIDHNANALLQKLQYSNGMSFLDVFPSYTLAKKIEEYMCENSDYHIRTRLLNSIGAFSYYYNESEKGSQYLEKAIRLVTEKGSNDNNEMLFLSKCYYNLALSCANSGNSQKALDAIISDIEIKQKIAADSPLYARSLDLYATILKTFNPIEASNIYLDVARKKECHAGFLYDDKKTQNDIVASWATALFNIGLLCRDVQLYDSAYEYVVLANKIRSKILDKCNRDFCSSLNVQAEIELMLQKTDNPYQIISIIDSKQSLPSGFDKIMGHTYYVCALYYFVREDFSMAYDYSERSLNELYKQKSPDFLQIVKSKLILALSLDYIKTTGIGQQYSSSIDIVNETISDITQNLGPDSFYLAYSYKALMLCPTLKSQKEFYAEKCYQIQEKYHTGKTQMKNDVNDYLKSIKEEVF